MSSVDNLKKDLAKLKSVFANKKPDVTKGDVTKPEEAPKAKPEPKKPFGKPQEPEPQDRDEPEDEPKQSPKPEVFKKKPNPFDKKGKQQKPNPFDKRGKQQPEPEDDDE